MKKHSTVIMTTHSMEEAEALVSKLAILVEGRVKTIGSVQQLKNKVQSDPKDSASDDIDFSKDQHDWKVRYHCNAFREGKLKQLEGELSFPLREVFDWLSPTMMSPVTESRLRVVISGRIQSAVLANARTYWAGSHAVSDIKIQQASFDDLKLRLKALSVIAFDQQGRWYLTPAGEQAALQVIQ